MTIKIQEGDEIGKLLGKYKQDIDKPLSAILSLNTIAHTVGAIGVGAQAGKLFGENELDLGFVSTSFESVIAGAMTLAILILSEIIPKTIGANRWRQLTPFTIRSIRLLMIVLAPLVWLSQWITKRLKRNKDISVFSKAALTAMARAGEESGHLEPGESTIIQNLLRLEKLQVRDIMTPRSVMLSADESMTIEAFDRKYKNLPFSRIPVFHDRADLITGVVLKDDILRGIADDKHTMTLSELRRDVLHIKDSVALSALLESLLKDHAHIAIVMDDYGSVAGLVTMEDLFETILGSEIVDESDAITDLQYFARKRWEARARRMGLIPDSATDELE